MSNKYTYQNILGIRRVGYDSSFWSFCIEDTRKNEITMMDRKDKLHKLKFQCPRNHAYTDTCFNFFHYSELNRVCPICISGNDVGAVNCDSEFNRYYKDSRYPVNEVSEFCRIAVSFECYRCGSEFECMPSVFIGRANKCPSCTLIEIKQNNLECDFTFINLK